MKRSKELIGIPIISIAEGIQVGAVKGLLINPYEKNVEFLLIDEPDASEELKGIPFLSAEVSGDFAITVESSCGIFDLLKVNILKDLVGIGLDLFGTKIITKKGTYIGEITEYSINLEDGYLAEIFYRGEGDDTEYSVSAEQVITIGKEALIIDDSVEVKESATTPQEELRNFNEGDERTATLSEEINIAIEQVIADEDDLSKTFVSSDSTEKEEVPDPVAIEADKNTDEVVDTDDSSEQKTDADAEDTEDQEKTLSKLVQQQRQYVLGKILIRDIKDENGEILAKENEKITDEIFFRLYKEGPQKIVEAMTYVKD